MFRKRCQCYTKISNYKLKCKCQKFVLIKNQPYCYIHGTIIFQESILIIQRYYIEFHVRKKLKNIFLKLPLDVRNKIIFHIRENFLIKKYNHDPIARILDTKVDLQYLDSIIMKINPFFIQISTLSNEEVDYLINIYKLYSKYELIAPNLKYNSLFKYKWYIYDRMEFLYESSKFESNKLYLLMSLIINYKPSYYPEIE